MFIEGYAGSTGIMKAMEQLGMESIKDERGRLTAMPEEQALRQAALNSLPRPFKHGRFYSENEVNSLLAESGIVCDNAMLRRELCGSGLLRCEGGKYWRSDFLRGEIDCEGAHLRDLRENDASLLLAIRQSIGYFNEISGEVFQQKDAQALIEKTDLPPDGSPEFFGAKIILTHDGQPAGYLATYEGYPGQDTLWVGSLFFHYEQHCKGLGGAVMHAVETNARDCGFQQMGLGVYALNTPGLKFWFKQGFRTIEKVTVSEYQRTILSLSKRL